MKKERISEGIWSVNQVKSDKINVGDMNLDVARRKDAASFGRTVRDVYVRVDKTAMSLYPPFQRNKAASLLAFCTILHHTFFTFLEYFLFTNQITSAP